jgi:hypothetical protein
VRVLTAAMEKNQPRFGTAPAQGTYLISVNAFYRRQRPGNAGLCGILGQQVELR